MILPSLQGCRSLCLLALVLLPAGRLDGASSLPVEASLPPTVELRQIGELVVPFQADRPIPTCEPQLRPRIDLSDGWRRWRTDLDHTLTLSARTPENLSSIEQEGKGAHSVERDDRLWALARLPEVANSPPYSGPSGVWYRRKVSIPPMWKERRVLFHCLAANYVADLWVNGRHVGYHEGGFTAFSFDITDDVRWGTSNTIALRVDNPPWPAPFPKSAQADLPRAGSRSPAAAAVAVSKETVPYGPCDWWNATGVLRDIYLEAVPAVSLVRADVRSEPAVQGTRVRVQVVLRHAGESAFAGQVTAQVSPALIAEANLTTPGADGLLSAGEPAPVVDGKPEMNVVVAPNTVIACVLDFTVGRLGLWSPLEPNLYVLEVELRDEQARQVDRLAIQFGVRTLAVDRDQARLVLNGQPTSLCGLARVEDDAQFGRAVTFGDGLKVLLDLRAAKWTGAEFLHLGHFVNHPITTLLADRVGLVCWEEIPAYRLDEQALTTQWERRRIARQMLIEMIYQDYNRPSVGFWGVCYDVPPGEAAVQFTRDLSDIARYLDGTRLVAESAVRVPAGPSECDVEGVALPAASYADPTVYQETVSLLDRLHAAHPHQPLVITEMGVAAGEEAPTFQRQASAARELVRALASRPFVAGWAWWTLADYQGPDGVRESGLMLRDRQATRPVAAALREEYQKLLPRSAAPQPPV